jgi:hypothetical protein
MNRGDDLVGFVYILTNPSMPNLVKIGHSFKHPRLRKEELASTGVPAPLEVFYFIFVRDARVAEKIIHEQLAAFRYERNREFFQVSPENAVRKIQETLAGEIIFESKARLAGMSYSGTKWENNEKYIVNSLDRKLEELFGSQGHFGENFEINSMAPLDSYVAIYYKTHYFKMYKLKIINLIKNLYSSEVEDIISSIGEFEKSLNQKPALDLIKKQQFTAAVFEMDIKNLIRDIEECSFFVIIWSIIRLRQRIMTGDHRVPAELEHWLTDHETCGFSNFIEIRGNFIGKGHIRRIARYPYEYSVSEETDGTANQYTFIGYKNHTTNEYPEYQLIGGDIYSGGTLISDKIFLSKGSQFRKWIRATENKIEYPNFGFASRAWNKFLFEASLNGIWNEY